MADWPKSRASPDLKKGWQFQNPEMANHHKNPRGRERLRDLYSFDEATFERIVAEALVGGRSRVMRKGDRHSAEARLRMSAAVMASHLTRQARAWWERQEADRQEAQRRRAEAAQRPYGSKRMAVLAHMRPGMAYTFGELSRAAGGKRRFNITDAVADGLVSKILNPEWSPDTKQIFDPRRMEQPRHLYVLTAKGEARRAAAIEWEARRLAQEAQGREETAPDRERAPDCSDALSWLR
jgi:hypothetical protein